MVVSSFRGMDAMDDKRKEHNKRLLERMKNHDDMLEKYDATSTWFQPRPIDKDKIKRIKKEKIEVDG